MPGTHVSLGAPAFPLCNPVPISIMPWRGLQRISPSSQSWEGCGLKLLVWEPGV